MSADARWQYLFLVLVIVMLVNPQDKDLLMPETNRATPRWSLMEREASHLATDDVGSFH